MKNINRVLCVEDNSEKYMAVNRFLRSQDVYKIDWVTNAEKALEFLSEAKDNNKPYDLLLSDMEFDYYGTLDSEAGEKLMHLLREKGYDIPVIFCSSQKWNIPGSFGSIFYNPRRDWELEAAELFRALKNQ